MRKDFIEETVKEIAGSNVVRLIKLIKGKKNVSEFKLAEKLKLTVNQVRNMLYKLYSYNLVGFIRKKDKKKGWYIYYWSFDSDKAVDVGIGLMKERLKKLKKRLEREKRGNFFICPDKCIRLRFEGALENDFKCPECGRVLEREDNKNRIRKIGEEIKNLEKELVKEVEKREKRVQKRKRPRKKKVVKKRKIRKREPKKKKKSKKNIKRRKKPRKKKVVKKKRSKRRRTK